MCSSTSPPAGKPISDGVLTSARYTPAAVCFGDKERFIGESASNQRIRFYKNTVRNMMWLLGRNWSDVDVQALHRE